MSIRVYTVTLAPEDPKKAEALAEKRLLSEDTLITMLATGRVRFVKYEGDLND